MLKKRGLALSIILTIVTCGIYGIVWMVKLSNEISAYNGEKIEGLLELLLIIVTGGIYGLYWYYKMAKKVTRAQAKTAKEVKDNSVVCLILGFIGLGIISTAIVQSSINELV